MGRATVILVIIATATTLSHATMAPHDAPTKADAPMKEDAPPMDEWMVDEDSSSSDMMQGRGFLDKLATGFPGLLSEIAAKLGATFGGKLAGGVGVGMKDGQAVGAKGEGEYEIKGTVDGKYEGGLGLLTEGKGAAAAAAANAGTTGTANTAATTGKTGTPVDTRIVD